MDDRVVSFDIEIKNFRSQINNAKELEETLKLIRKAAKDQEFDSDSLKEFTRAQAALTLNQRKLREEVKLQENILRSQDKTYRGLSAQLIVARNSAKDLAVQFGRNSQEFKEAQADVLRLDKQLKDIDASVGQFQRNVGNYPEAFRAAFSDVAGNILPNFGGQLKSQLEGLGVGTDLVGSLTNPLTIGLSAAVAIAQQAFIAIRDVVLEYEQLFSQVNRTTGLVGLELQENTARLNTISQTFGQDFERVLQSANNASQGFGRDFSDTLDVIELGLLNIAGGEAQDEFLDSFREYPQLIDNAGFSLEEFTKLAVLSSQRGVFSDKLIDSIKEADLSLAEFTQTQSDALSGVLGEQATRSIERRIRTGSLSTRDAILEIGTALEEAGADVQDYAEITEKVFSGAGEDAGGFQDILQLVRESTEELSIPTDAYTQRLISQRDATFELETEQSRLAATFAGTGSSLEGVTTRLKAFGLSIVNDVISNVRTAGRVFEDEGFLSGVTSFIRNNTGIGIALGLGRSDEFNALQEQIAREDADALAEVEAGRKTAAEQRAAREQREAEQRRRNEQNEVAAKREQAKRLKEINDQIEEDRKAAEERAQFLLDNPEGSINLLNFRLKELRDSFGSAASTEARSLISAQIDEVTESIKRLKAEGQPEVLSDDSFVSGQDDSLSADGLSQADNELAQLEADLLRREQLELETEQRIQDEKIKIEEEANDRRIALANQIAGINLDNLEEAKEAALDILFDQISATLQARAIEAFATTAANIPFPLGPILGGVAAAGINALLGRLRSAIFGEHGFQLDSKGNVVGNRHSQGGEWGMINGRLANIERGESVQQGENGAISVINRKATRANQGLLSAIKNKIFPGKNALLAAINGGFNDQNLSLPFSFAQTGAQFSPVGAPSSFVQEITLSEESIEGIKTAAQEGTMVGSRSGSREGLETANEQIIRLEELRSQTTF